MTQDQQGACRAAAAAAFLVGGQGRPGLSRAGHNLRFMAAPLAAPRARRPGVCTPRAFELARWFYVCDLRLASGGYVKYSD